jgi:hypothetical protein
MENGEGLGMKIPKHGVRLPAPHEPEDRGVNPTDEESHGTSRAETAGIHISRKKTKVGAQGGGLPKNSGDERGRDGTSGRGEDGTERSGGGGMVGAKVGDATEQGGSGTGKRMAATAVAHHFTPGTVFLGVECQGDMSGLV